VNHAATTEPTTRLGPRSRSERLVRSVLFVTALVLTMLPDEPANYALELRHYAALAGLPERLYRPMAAPADGLRARDTSGEVTQELAARAGVDVTSGPTAR
jgi:hypothetical protein